MPELYQKLLKLEEETELLRDVNRALRGENVFLKASLENAGSAPQGERRDHVSAPPHSQLPHLGCAICLELEVIKKLIDGLTRALGRPSI